MNEDDIRRIVREEIAAALKEFDTRYEIEEIAWEVYERYSQ